MKKELSDTQILDASRYRWLRDRGLNTISAGGVFAGRVPENVVLCGDDLDDAIDVAMLKSEIKPNATKPTFCHKHG